MATHAFSRIIENAWGAGINTRSTGESAISQIWAFVVNTQRSVVKRKSALVIQKWLCYHCCSTTRGCQAQPCWGHPEFWTSTLDWAWTLKTFSSPIISTTVCWPGPRLATWETGAPMLPKGTPDPPSHLTRTSSRPTLTCNSSSLKKFRSKSLETTSWLLRGSTRRRRTSTDTFPDTLWEDMCCPRPATWARLSPSCLQMGFSPLQLLMWKPWKWSTKLFQSLKLGNLLRLNQLNRRSNLILFNFVDM